METTIFLHKLKNNNSIKIADRIIQFISYSPLNVPKILMFIYKSKSVSELCNLETVPYINIYAYSDKLTDTLHIFINY